MANAILGLFGFVLIIITFIILLTATPTMYNSVCTTSGCALENVTNAEKTVLGIYQFIILVLPFITFGVGVIFVLAGVK